MEIHYSCEDIEDYEDCQDPEGTMLAHREQLGLPPPIPLAEPWELGPPIPIRDEPSWPMTNQADWPMPTKPPDGVVDFGEEDEVANLIAAEWYDEVKGLIAGEIEDRRGLGVHDPGVPGRLAHLDAYPDQAGRVEGPVERLEVVSEPEPDPLLLDWVVTTNNQYRYQIVGEDPDPYNPAMLNAGPTAGGLMLLRDRPEADPAGAIEFFDDWSDARRAVAVEMIDWAEVVDANTRRDPGDPADLPVRPRVLELIEGELAELPPGSRFSRIIVDVNGEQASFSLNSAGAKPQVASPTPGQQDDLLAKLRGLTHLVRQSSPTRRSVAKWARSRLSGSVGQDRSSRTWPVVLTAPDRLLGLSAHGPR